MFVNVPTMGFTISWTIDFEANMKPTFALSCMKPSCVVSFNVFPGEKKVYYHNFSTGKILIDFFLFSTQISHIPVSGWECMPSLTAFSRWFGLSISYKIAGSIGTENRGKCVLGYVHDKNESLFFQLHIFIVQLKFNQWPKWNFILVDFLFTLIDLIVGYNVESREKSWFLSWTRLNFSFLDNIFSFSSSQ